MNAPTNHNPWRGSQPMVGKLQGLVMVAALPYTQNNLDISALE